MLLYAQFAMFVFFTKELAQILIPFSRRKISLQVGESHKHSTSKFHDQDNQMPETGP